MIVTLGLGSEVLTVDVQKSSRLPMIQDAGCSLSIDIPAPAASWILSLGCIAPAAPVQSHRLSSELVC